MKHTLKTTREACQKLTRSTASQVVIDGLVINRVDRSPGVSLGHIEIQVHRAGVVPTVILYGRFNDVLSRLVKLLAAEVTA